MLNRKFKTTLTSGAPVLGTFVKISTPMATEIIGLAGFDFVIVDAEHGNFTHAEVENAVRAAEVAGIGSIVRVPDAQESNILHALDSRASGVQVPSLRTAEDIERAVRAARFHPKGQRGFSKAARAAAYGGMSLDAFLADADDTLVIVHVENREMVENIDAACAVDGVDVLFIGTGDLSQSLGHTGLTQHPHVKDAVARVVKAGRAGGKILGAVATSQADVKALLESGIRYIVWQSDIGMLAGAAREAARAFRSAV